MNPSLSLGVVGATGLVGETFLRLLEPSAYPIKELRLFASPKSKGKKLSFRDQQWECQTLGENCFANLDLVFFSSGDEISREWAPKAVAQRAIAIDNSAAYRMDSPTPLVVPEVNFQSISDPHKPQVIANPNCSTIQLVMALHALKKWEPKECRVATYQSVSGAGKEAIQDLFSQTQDSLGSKNPREGQYFNPPIAFECQPKIGSYKEDGFCSEEWKIMKETKKILEWPELKMSAFTVRVPTPNGHGEAVWVTLGQEATKEDLETCFKACPYVQYLAGKEGEKSFHSYDEVSQASDVFVSRLRKDPEFEKTWMFWLVADNLYRGAASNGLLIANRIFENLLN